MSLISLPYKLFLPIFWMTYKQCHIQLLSLNHTRKLVYEKLMIITLCPLPKHQKSNPDIKNRKIEVQHSQAVMSRFTSSNRLKNKSKREYYSQGTRPTYRKYVEVALSLLIKHCIGDSRGPGYNS